MNPSAEKYLTETGVNSEEQMQLIISNPIHYLKVLYNNLKVHGKYYLYGCVGQNMGWLSIILPAEYVVLYIVLLFVSIFAEKNEKALDIKDKIWMIVLALIMCLLIVTGFYIEYSEVGVYEIAGVQGRYFIPVLLIALLSLCSKESYIKIKNPYIVISICSLIINILYIKQIVLFFI